MDLVSALKERGINTEDLPDFLANGLRQRVAYDQLGAAQCVVTFRQTGPMRASANFPAKKGDDISYNGDYSLIEHAFVYSPSIWGLDIKIDEVSLDAGDGIGRGGRGRGSSTGGQKLQQTGAGKNAQPAAKAVAGPKRAGTGTPSATTAAAGAQVAQATAPVATGPKPG